MSFKIITPQFYGKAGVNYRLEKDDIVPRDFFLSADRKDCLKHGFIEHSKERPNQKLDGSDIPLLADITQMTVAQAKEFLEEEPHIVNLEKYLDQENAQEFTRKTITRYIERRIKELTGFE
jgi:hypothetical protein